ncbi:MAG: hypothetical protein EBX41_05540, partial [Chitinophagia bacterium]|nr:hypothetical protein [Chitinophagia bacterium]
MVQLRSTSTFSWFTTLVNKIALLIAFCVMGSSSLFAQTITHFGGTPGTAGYGGDGGPATMALMERPTGIAVDGAGNVYIADSKNNCIRMVATNGDITTIAGNGNIPGGDDGDDLPA